MAKAKGPLGVQNRHIYTRASYLYQAAAYLATASLQPQSQQPHNAPSSSRRSSADEPAAAAAASSHDAAAQVATSTDDRQRTAALRNMSRQLLADMRVVSLKVLIRQRPEIKRSVCRGCDSLLVEGGTCDAVVENASRGRRKPWADVLVVTCRTCGRAKRFPVGEPAKKQLRKNLREKAKHEREDQDRDVGHEEPLKSR